MKELNINAVATGIKSKFDESTILYNSVDGRMSFGDNFQGTLFPQIVFNFISIVLIRTFEKKSFLFRVQFDVYSDKVSGIECQNICSYLDAVYGNDDLNLSITGYNFKRMDFESSNSDKIPASETGNKNLWNIPVDYMLLLETI